MKYPKIEIYTENKAEFEAQYICFLAKGVSNDIYQNGGYTVLPTLIPGFSKSVHFPSLSYSKEFWRSINFCSNNDLNTQFPKKAVNEVQKSLSKKTNLETEKACEVIKNSWQNMEKDFFGNVENFLDLSDALSKVEKIKILITPYGTIGSFNPSRVGNNFNLMVTSRVDVPAGNIAHLILQNLYIIKTRIGGEIGDGNYTKRMSAMTFLMTNTVFKKYYPDFTDLTKPSFNINQKYLDRSKKYLDRLGFGHIQANFLTKVSDFTKQEEEVITLLQNHAGKIVSFDSVAKALWGKDSFDKFSLEAMAKVIENIRRKIKSFGVNKEVIFTKRGKGYLLN